MTARRPYRLLSRSTSGLLVVVGRGMDASQPDFHDFGEVTSATATSTLAGARAVSLIAATRGACHRTVAQAGTRERIS